MDVSRETPPGPPVPPEAARGVFSSTRFPLIERYAAHLAVDGTLRGLIGPREVPRLWDRHILNCAVLQDAIPEQSTAADIGSGAGLPGLVLAIARPDLTITLIEPLLRRTTFLEEVVADLELDNVTVFRGRSEEIPKGTRFDVVTSRAVAPLDRLLRWSMPLVAPHGSMIALKGSSAADEVSVHRQVWQKMGCDTPELLCLGEGLLDSPTYALLVSWKDPNRVGLAGSSKSKGRSKKSSGAGARNGSGNLPADGRTN